MGRLLLALDPITVDEASLAAQLAHTTGKPAAEWRRMLVAPKLARVVVGADTASDAKSLAARLESAGIAVHIVDQADAQGAFEQAFEATFAEPSREDILFIAADGRQLDVENTSIRSITTGVQSGGGQTQRFVVFGLKIDPGAVVVRIPGAELSKAVGDGVGIGEADDDDIFERFVAFAQKMAPHAVLERGLERHTGKLVGLGEAGTRDLAHAAVLAAFLVRKFPPAPNPARIPQAPAHADDVRALRPDEHVELAKPVRRDVAPSRGSAAPIKLLPTAEQLARAKKNRIIAAAVAAAVAVIAAAVMLHTPKSTQHVLRMHESWLSPYGVTFSYRASYDAGVAGVDDVGFVVDVAKGGDTQTARFPARESASERDAFGVHWRVTNHDEGAWIAIEAHR